jgi:hypothetical protein
MARRTGINLSPPSQIAFIISLIIALVGILAAADVLTGLPITSVWIMAIAYVVLAGACLVRGA